MSLQNITRPNNFDLWIKYAPSDSGDWGTSIPNNVSQALDELASRQQAEDVLTTQGDMIVADVSGEPARLPIGTSNQVLMVQSGMPSWETMPESAVFVTSPLAGDGTSVDPIEISTGSVGQILQTTLAGPVWSSIPGLGLINNGNVGTNNNTWTTLISIPTSGGRIYYVSSVISYFEPFNLGNSGFFTIRCSMSNTGTLVIGSTIIEKINSSTYNVRNSVSGNNLLIEVQGGVGTNLNWNTTTSVFDPFS